MTAMGLAILGSPVALAQSASNPPPGITIVIHGFNSSSLGWAREMGRAISARQGNAPTRIIQVERAPNPILGSNKAQLAASSDILYLDGAPNVMGRLGGGRQVILVNWSAADSGAFCEAGIDSGGVLSSVPTDDVAAVVEGELRNYIKTLSVPIHIIGHSRGGSIATALAKRLGKRGIVVDHLTLLDRHPCPTDENSLEVSSNVVFADQYLQLMDWPDGFQIPGAYTVDTSSFIEAGTNLSCENPSLNFIINAHTNIHTYYHATIDPQRTSCVDGVKIQDAWFDTSAGRPAKASTGYAFSRQAPSQPQRSRSAFAPTGLSNLFPGAGGSATRVTWPFVGGADPPWPNVIARDLPGGYFYQTGQAIQIPYYYQQQGGGMEVVISLDDDTNPFNTPLAPCNKVITPAPRTHAGGASYGQDQFTWQTGPNDVGSCFIQLRAQTAEQQRFDYVPDRVSVGVLPTNPLATSFVVEPNYAVNLDRSSILGVAGAPGLVLTLGGTLDFGDYITITDQNGEIVRMLTGVLPTQPFNVAGSQIHVRFKSNANQGTSLFGGPAFSNGASVSVASTNSSPTRLDVPGQYGISEDWSQSLFVPNASALSVTLQGSLDFGDILYVTDQNGAVIRQLTGVLPTAPFIVAGSQIRVRFKSNANAGNTITAGPSVSSGASLVVAPSNGTPTRVDVPGQYGVLHDWSQLLFVPNASALSVSLQGSLDFGDVLTLTDQDGVVVRQLTGVLPTTPFIVSGGQVLVRFTSDANAGNSIASGPSTSSGASLVVASSAGTPARVDIPGQYGTNHDWGQTLFLPGVAGLSVALAGSIDAGDSLAVTDQNGSVVRQLTGDLTGKSFSVAGSRIGVRFRSDGNAGNTLSSGPSVSSGASLVLTSGTGSQSQMTISGQHGANQDWSQVLSVPGAAALTVSLTGALGAGGTLTITNQSGGVVGTFSGSLPTSPLSVSGSQIRIRFVSTSASSAPGLASVSVAASGPVLVDTSPIAFSYTGITNAVRASLYESSVATVSGINAPTPVSVAGGWYRVNNGTPTTQPGFVNMGDAVRGVVLSAGTLGTATTAIVTIGDKSAAFTVTTAFLQYQLSVAAVGMGSVTSSPSGINCGATCNANFNSGVMVTLTASAATGSTFTGWSGGGCSGTGTCNVTMDAAKSVTATFAIQQFALTISKTGGGSGLVTSTPSGIDCGATCNASFNSGVSVSLGAAPASDSFFAGWSGGGCTGTGACNVTMDAAKTVTATFKLNTTIPRLANIATRMQVLTGADVLIGGFIIGGSQAKTVVVRARGPSLTAAGVPGALQNPLLQLFSGQTVIAANDDWQQATNATALQNSGFAPADPKESAILITLGPGAYTAIVSGVGGTTGVGIVEVFEVDLPQVPLINIATRGQVLTQADVMIGGFIIQGDAPQTVIVRARGPSLTAAGVPGALQDPVLQLFSGQTQIGVNDDWQTDSNAGQIQSRGFAPSDARESAILVTLPPGAYTAIVTGKNGTTGVGIIEVFAQ